MSYEVRLVPMMEVTDVDGKVLRYTHPYDVGAKAWWENGITEEEVEALIVATEDDFEYVPELIDKLRATWGKR